MQRVSRREFLKLGGGLAAASAVWPRRAFSQEDLPEFIEAALFPLEEYPYREWEELYREQLKFDSSFAAHIDYGRYTAYVRKDMVLRLEPWFGDHGRYGGSVGRAKAFASLRRVYSKARIRQPLLRKGFLEGEGERGSGAWQPISWDKAYDLMAKKILEVMQSDGPESIKMVTASLATGPVSKQGALARFANMLGAVVWLDRDVGDAEDLEGTRAYYFEDPEAPGGVKKRLRFESPVGFITGREARKTKVRWHARHDFLSRCGSLSEVINKRDPEVEMIVVQASEFDLTCEYADVVLPVHTWAEAPLPDLAVLGPTLAVDLARGGIKPLYDSRMDLEIAAAVAGRMSQLSQNPIYASYWKSTPEAFIQKILDAGGATQGVKVGDFAPGPKTLPTLKTTSKRQSEQGRSLLELVKTIKVPRSRPDNALYLVVREGRHSFGPEWGLADFSQVLAGSFGDPWRLDTRAPNLGEAELKINPADARARGIADGDYVWVDPASTPALDTSLRTLVRCTYNPGISAGLALVWEGWHPATPETKKAQEDGQGRAITPRGYGAHYRSGGAQYVVAVRAEVQKNDRGIGYASLAAKEAMISIARAEDGKYAPAASGFAPAHLDATMQRYLAGELSRQT
ncbi:MAG: molybdopterin-dependent oxidoreductase [Dehalococcoidia bacterium]